MQAARRRRVLARSRRFADTGVGLSDQEPTIHTNKGERTMKNPLDSLWGTVIAGVVLTAVLYVFARNFLS